MNNEVFDAFTCTVYDKVFDEDVGVLILEQMANLLRHEIFGWHYEVFPKTVCFQYICNVSTYGDQF